MKATWTLSDTAGNEDDLVDQVYLYLNNGASTKQCSASLKRQIQLRSERVKLRNAWRAVLQNVRTDVQLVTMRCIASVNVRPRVVWLAVLQMRRYIVASYYICAFHSLGQQQ